MLIANFTLPPSPDTHIYLNITSFIRQRICVHMVHLINLGKHAYAMTTVRIKHTTVMHTLLCITYMYLQTFQCIHIL